MIALGFKDPLLSMKKWVEQQSDDLEYRQAVVRLILISVLMTFIIFYNIFSHTSWSEVKDILFIWGVYLLEGMLILSLVNRSIGLNHPRRCITIFMDALLCCMVCWVNGLASAPYIFIFTWLGMGNGYRYGPKYMIYASILSVFFLIILLSFSPEWQKVSKFQSGIVLFAVILMGYIWTVLTTILKSRTALSEMANQDSLTGLPNRAYLIDYMKKEISQCRRNHKFAGCIYFDLDGFKQVNDQFGHAAGDKLLVEIARVSKIAIRPTDLVARIAGDEFAVILETSRENAHILAKRLLFQIESIVKIDNHNIDISASLGIAFDDSDFPDTPEQLLKKADIMMYKAKKAGKRQIAIENPIDIA